MCDYDSKVVDALNKMAKDYICTASFDSKPWIESWSGLFPYFMGSIGAVDGTHIPALVPDKHQGPFRDNGCVIT